MIVKHTLTWNIKEAKPILQQEDIKKKILPDHNSYKVGIMQIYIMIGLPLS